MYLIIFVRPTVDNPIHGCIVDIDYYNHIYLDIENGAITPYFAISITEKYEYSNIVTLLLERRKDLYRNLVKIQSNQNSDNYLLYGEETQQELRAKTKMIKETFMYGPSRILRSIQYITDANVIRIWNENVFASLSHKNNIINQCRLSDI